MAASTAHSRPLTPNGSIAGLVSSISRTEHADIWNYPGPVADRFRQRNQVLIEHCTAIGRDPAEIVRSMQTVIRCADPGAPAAARDELLQMIDAGVTHIVLAPILAGHPVQWLVDEIIEPVIGQAARR